MNNSVIKFDLTHYIVDTATELSEKTAGLEVVSSLEDHGGMLFPFDPPQHVTFHMGKVQYPIDIVFIEGSAGVYRVSKIIHSVQPGDCGTWSERHTRYVLEIKGGQCKGNNICVGSVCTISDIVSLKSAYNSK